MFVGRKKELSYLEEMYNKGQKSILCLYGQKGIGKTTLLMNFVKDKNVCYISARPCSEKESLIIMGLEMAIDYKGEPNYSELFKGLKFRAEGKKVLIIDEFHNLVKNSSNFIPELINYVNLENDNIMVVLCSSSICFVENLLVPKLGQYAKSFNAFYKVLPLSFMDCVNYFSNYETEDCMQVYSLLGGNPSYWNAFSDSMTVRENIINGILSENSILRNEVMNLINEELREIGVYSTILYCLACGYNKLNDLHVHTGYSRAKISVYLSNLMDRQLVEKVFSFQGASSISSMKGVYRISSPYIHFYFRFIFRNESKLILDGPVKFYDTYIEHDLDLFYDEHFRTICHEFLGLLNQMNRLPIKADKTGEWVGKKGSIDVILQNDEDSLLCFCDWKKSVITLKDYKKYTQIAQDARLHLDYMIILARGEFDSDLLRLEQSLDNLQLIKASTL